MTGSMGDAKCYLWGLSMLKICAILLLPPPPPSYEDPDPPPPPPRPSYPGSTPVITGLCIALVRASVINTLNTSMTVFYVVDIKWYGPPWTTGAGEQIYLSLRDRRCPEPAGIVVTVNGADSSFRMHVLQCCWCVLGRCRVPERHVGHKVSTPSCQDLQTFRRCWTDVFRGGSRIFEKGGGGI